MLNLPLWLLILIPTFYLSVALLCTLAARRKERPE